MNNLVVVKVKDNIDLLEIFIHNLYRDEDMRGTSLVVHDHSVQKCNQIKVEELFKSGWIHSLDKAVGNSSIDLESQRNNLIKHGDDICVIIPYFRMTSSHTLRQVMNSFLNQTNDQFSLYLCTYDKTSEEEIMRAISFGWSDTYVEAKRVDTFEVWSRARAFNRAVIKLPMHRHYIFHDRDLEVSNDFIENIKWCRHGMDYFINFNKLNKDGKIDVQAVGGSCTVSWHALHCINGMHSGMEHWGAEDRDFDARLNKFSHQNSAMRVINIVTHMHHEQYPIAPDSNQRMKNANSKLSREMIMSKCRYLHNDYNWYWDERKAK